MIYRITHCYPARLVFVAAVLPVAAVIVLFRIVFRDGRALLRANLSNKH